MTDSIVTVSQTSASSCETQPLESQELALSYTPTDENGNNTCWGKLISLHRDYESIDLRQRSILFGRDINCDYTFKKGSSTTFYTLSKQHFKLLRETSNGDDYTELEDWSTNGTYINGTKLGNGKKQVLVTHDEIAFASSTLKAFMYVDLNSPDQLEIDKAVKDRYTVCKKLGSGSYGEVRLAFEKGSCRKCAIKIIDKNLCGFAKQVSTPEAIMNEVNVQKGLDHPCIIKIEDVIDTERTLYIVLEIVEGGELFDKIANEGQLNEQTSKIIFYQLLLATKYLHDKGITHRDLKPENILLSKNCDNPLIKIADFGISKYVDEHTKLKTFCGTPNYLAPEVITNSESNGYTNAVDCWSLGIILHCCLAGHQPFDGEGSEQKTLYKRICAGKIEFPKKYWKNISPQAQDLVNKLLKVNPEERLTIPNALNHPWFKDEKLKKSISNLLKFKFSKRSFDETTEENGNDETMEENENGETTQEIVSLEPLKKVAKYIT